MKFDFLGIVFINRRNADIVIYKDESGYCPFLPLKQ